MDDLQKALFIIQMVEIKQESGVETIKEKIKDKKWLLLNLPLKKKG